MQVSEMIKQSAYEATLREYPRALRLQEKLDHDETEREPTTAHEMFDSYNDKTQHEVIVKILNHFFGDYTLEEVHSLVISQFPKSDAKFIEGKIKKIVGVE
ncbi:MAG: hypothetical protein UR73_C0037G0006 [candidate division WS6 bacterium GW2011_GWF1_35_23]|uniref:Uncharacterized protein n=1 Tax=candidate division WS6 bacterium GW2011_GWF1_35_23 TaxID=1619097 RepID=A0A0G0F5A6_9BACT|nr:MAG: hypothetical protein UR73_C0037G0006 [candidate division WS6 bacterium GW2011_GWF1_35_23]